MFSNITWSWTNFSDVWPFYQSWFAGPHSQWTWRPKIKNRKTVGRRGVQLHIFCLCYLYDTYIISIDKLYDTSMEEFPSSCLDFMKFPGTFFQRWRCWNDKAQFCGLPNGFQCGLLGQAPPWRHRGFQVAPGVMTGVCFFLVSMGFPWDFYDLKIGFPVFGWHLCKNLMGWVDLGSFGWL